MKTVMVMIHDDAGQEDRLQVALDVTRAVEGHLVCLDVVMVPVIADGFGVGVGGAAGVMILDEREREDENVRRLEPRLANEGVSYEWARAVGNSDTAIVDDLRLTDLIVVGKQGAGDFFDSGSIAARLAERTSTPILLVPPGQASLDLFGPALVAWDGSAPADTAIRAAVPLLRLASGVEVLTIGNDGAQDADPNEVAAYLDRHGCKVTTRTLPKSRDVGEQLLEQLAASGAHWAVMGSYGRNRLRQQLFGGTTRTLLAKAPIPLLILH